MSFLPCVPNDFWFKNISNIFNLSVCNVPHVFIGVLQHCIQCQWTFNVFLLLQKGFFNVQPDIPIVFVVCFFYTPCYHFVIFLSTFSFLYCLEIFYHLWCCLGMFLLQTKLRSFFDQNITPIWILINDVWIWECLLSQHPILKCCFKAWPTNNYNSSKVQF